MKGFGNSGVEVSVLGQGTWEMGDRAADEEREVESLREDLALLDQTFPSPDKETALEML